MPSDVSTPEGGNLLTGHEPFPGLGGFANNSLTELFAGAVNASIDSVCQRSLESEMLRGFLLLRTGCNGSGKAGLSCLVQVLAEQQQMVYTIIAFLYAKAYLEQPICVFSN
ncbi:MAG: hypothetical protein IKK57_05080 [Clostridia bacterium]|nr:hypothetical protein [Clostridia bacterium]